MLISFPVGSPANFLRALSAISEEVVKADFLVFVQDAMFRFRRGLFFSLRRFAFFNRKGEYALLLIFCMCATVALGFYTFLH